MKLVYVFRALTVTLAVVSVAVFAQALTRPDQSAFFGLVLILTAAIGNIGAFLGEFES